MAWVRDHGHRAALLRVVCSAWAPGSSLPPCPTLPLSPSPHSSFSTLPPSLSLPGGSICSKSQANLIQCRPVCSSYIYHSCFVDLCLWGGTVWEFQRLCCDIDIQKCRWGGGEKMKSMQRNPVTSSCHCSGVARSDSKISAKALYGKWLHGRSILLLACLQDFAFTCNYTCPPLFFLIIMAWDFTAHTL